MTQVVRVQFRNSPCVYDYFTDLTLKNGDYAVVATDPGFAVVRIIKTQVQSKKASKWIVQKVDTEKYQLDCFLRSLKNE